MKHVYVAGPYSSDNIIQALDNIRAGRRMALLVLLNDLAPICPWLDSELFMQLREGEKISLERIQAYSMRLLSRCDAMLVIGEWHKSKGTKAEIEFAFKNDIPIFYDLKEVIEWSKNEQDKFLAEAP